MSSGAGPAALAAAAKAAAKAGQYGEHCGEVGAADSPQGVGALRPCTMKHCSLTAPEVLTSWPHSIHKGSGSSGFTWVLG